MASTSLPEKKIDIGTVEASEQLITDLYLNLRKRLAMWASITKQTAQARMGYIGQHLVSVVTGFPGGKSGARGKDLVISDKEFGEIKTCYRVDQLGKCQDCGCVAASIEDECSACGSPNLKRNDDSKWLISIRNDDEFKAILDPKFYFFVLLEFVDLAAKDKSIRASIWRVNPAAKGFLYCMIDYYLNIRTKSNSKAPFNLWPYDPKFLMMQPELIYRSVIGTDDKIKTEIFPSRDRAISETIELDKHVRSKTFSVDTLLSVAAQFNLRTNNMTRSELSDSIHKCVIERKVTAAQFADALAEACYGSRIRDHRDKIPEELRKKL
jgi:hypothetical protein